MALHKNLTDPDLHEPKGVASASVNKVYVSNGSGSGTWSDYTAGTLNKTQHDALRSLIHFIDNGPAEQFASGAYREMTGTTFPSSIIWYDSSGVGKKKIVEKSILYTGVLPTTITWKMYDASETLLVTVTDSIAYSGVFETSRTRTIV